MTPARDGVEARLRAIGPASLTPVVRAALGAGGEDAEAAGWRLEPLAAGLGAATGGLFRVHGTAHARGGLAPWAAVLKVLRPPSGTRRDAVAREPAHWAYWRREALAYGSGLLADLPGGLAAPRYLGVEEVDGAPNAAGGSRAGRGAGAGEAVWLWLEVVPDRYGGRWPRERTLLAARHLGAFGGAYPAGRRALPAVPWLGRGYLRQRIEEAPETLPLFEDRATWERPPLREHFAPGTAGRLRDVWARRGTLLDALDGVPPTLRHGDCHPGNLFAVAVAGGERTVAIDWGTAGIGPLGADLAELALSGAVDSRTRGRRAAWDDLDARPGADRYVG